MLDWIKSILSTPVNIIIFVFGFFLLVIGLACWVLARCEINISTGPIQLNAPYSKERERITITAGVIAILVGIPLIGIPAIQYFNGGGIATSGNLPSTSTPTLTPAPTSSPSPTLGSASVLITTPTDGSKVPVLRTIQGTAQNIPNDEELWLFIVPSNQTDYFPQPGPIEISGGKWKEGVRFGDKDNTGLRFRLIPVLINQNDQEAHDRINKYRQQPEGHIYKGIQLTGEMQPQAEITVIRE